MTPYEIALNIVQATKNMGCTAPQKTEFYIHFAGRSDTLIECSWDSIKQITRKNWQDAKETVYNDYNFYTGANNG